MKTAAKENHKEVHQLQTLQRHNHNLPPEFSQTRRLNPYLLYLARLPPKQIFVSSFFIPPQLLSGWLLRKGACGSFSNMTFTQIHQTYWRDSAPTVHQRVQIHLCESFFCHMHMRVLKNWVDNLHNCER